MCLCILISILRLFFVNKNIIKSSPMNFKIPIPKEANLLNNNYNSPWFSFVLFFQEKENRRDGNPHCFFIINTPTFLDSMQIHCYFVINTPTFIDSCIRIDFSLLHLYGFMHLHSLLSFLLSLKISDFFLLPY